MKKLAIIDLMFRWPPDGGARIDLKETASRLALIIKLCCLLPKSIASSRGE